MRIGKATLRSKGHHGIERERTSGDGLEPELPHDEREHQGRLGQRKDVPDARARSAPERHVRVLVTRFLRSGRPSRRIKALRVVPYGG